MTDKRKAAYEHGILDERTLDRRRFLARLGAGVAGATFLGLTDVGGLADALARPVIATTRGSGATRPIYMVALGDSVMWGQGLSDAQKFQGKIERWIETTNPQRRQVQRWNFAHSGATIAGLKGVATSHTTGQMTAAVFARQSSSNRGRGFEDMADFEPRGPGGSAQGSGSSSGSPSPGRPIESSAGDMLGGEIPRTYPTVWRQLDLALETMRTGRDPRNPKGGQQAPIDPAEMDLVLLNGGANDVDFLGTICNEERKAEETYAYVRGMVESRMKTFLPAALAAFPQATFVMPTYYQGISDQSTAMKLGPLVRLVAAIVGGGGGEAFLQTRIPRLIRQNDAMQRAITDAYRAAVASVPAAASRIHVVAPDFKAQHGYGAPQSFLFHLEDTDPAERQRRAECQTLFDQWVGDMVARGHSSSNADTPIKLLCDDASAFHPNVAGANHYFVKIRDTLAQASPAFMRPLPKMRVAVNGTVNGDAKTVTVTAFDAASGAPLAGTVSIAGVTGRTGSAVGYKASACVVDGGTSGGAGPGRVRRPPAGRTAAGRPGLPPAATAACTGKVTVPGYSDETFRY